MNIEILNSIIEVAIEQNQNMQNQKNAKNDNHDNFGASEKVFDLIFRPICSFFDVSVMYL